MYDENMYTTIYYVCYFSLKIYELSELIMCRRLLASHYITNIH